MFSVNSAQEHDSLKRTGILASYELHTQSQLLGTWAVRIFALITAWYLQILSSITTFIVTKQMCTHKHKHDQMAGK